MNQLETLRDEIRSRSRHLAEVNDRFTRFEEWWSCHPNQDVPVAMLRCNDGHKNGRRPVLAKVYFTADFGALFLARIAWVAADQLNLRPWQRDHLIATGDAELPDEVLATWINGLERQSAGLPRDGDRWLLDMDDFVIREVLDLSSVETGRPGLWVRCKSHTATPEKLDRVDLMNRARTQRQRQRA